MNPLTEEHVAEIARRVAAEVVALHTPVIAEAAATRAIQIVGSEVGMTIIKKAGMIIGLGVLALAGWLFHKGLWS